MSWRRSLTRTHFVCIRVIFFFLTVWELFRSRACGDWTKELQDTAVRRPRPSTLPGTTRCYEPNLLLFNGFGEGVVLKREIKENFTEVAVTYKAKPSSASVHSTRNSFSDIFNFLFSQLTWELPDPLRGIFLYNHWSPMIFFWELLIMWWPYSFTSPLSMHTLGGALDETRPEGQPHTHRLFVAGDMSGYH